MADRVFARTHNVLVDLDLTRPGAQRVADILTFLARSRIRHAITASPPLNMDILTDFWTDITYDASVNPPVIRTTVGNRPIVFSAADLREILRLGAEEQEAGPTEFSSEFIDGAIGRMGYVGPQRGKQYLKALVFGQWRFLWNVLLTVFAPKKGGFDELPPTLMSGVLSLVYNKPYSFSSYVFENFRAQVTGQVKTMFMLYPRFCMMIIRHFLHDLPPYAPTVSVDTIELRGYNAAFKIDSRRPPHLRPENRDLFGFIVDPHYVAPPNNGWLEGGAGAGGNAAADVPAEPAGPGLVPPPEPQELIEDVL